MVQFENKPPYRWKTVRVFISSTFRDMHAERDYLVKYIFPDLKEWCERWKIHLVDIDLRWGITVAEAESGKVIDICLDQIDGSRPFFICILGNRYGWVPEHDDVPLYIRERYDRLAGKEDYSVTHLEIHHAVLEPLTSLDETEEVPHAFFFFRDEKSTPDPKTIENWSDAERIEYQKTFFDDDKTYSSRLLKLKSIIRARYEKSDEVGERVFTYSPTFDPLLTNPEDDKLIGRLTPESLKEFGDKIKYNLEKAINLQFEERIIALSQKLEEDNLEAELDFHESFVENRTKLFIGRSDLLNELHNYVEGDSKKILAVFGEPGSGKSALLSKFYLDVKDKIGEKDLLIPHFVGASPGSSALLNLLRRMCEELKVKYSIEGEIPVEANKLSKTFIDFLTKVTSKTIILIDGLDQLNLSEQAHELSWLPNELPDKVMIIASTLEGDAKTSLEKLTDKVLNVSLFSDDECRKVIKEMPSVFAKTLDEGSVSKLAFSKVADISDADSETIFEKLRYNGYLNDKGIITIERFESDKDILSESSQILGYDEPTRIKIVDILQQALNKAPVNILLKNKRTRNPLYLKVVIEELRIFGSFEKLEEKIDSFPPDLIDLFAYVLNRLEEDHKHNPGLVEKLFCLLECSRYGLTAQELKELLADDKDKIHLVILRQIRDYLLKREKLIDFFHQGLSKAILQKYLTNRRALKWHKMLAEYFQNKPLYIKRLEADPNVSFKQKEFPNKRKLIEQPFQETHAEMWNEITQTLCNLWFVEAKVRASMVYELQEDYRFVLDRLPETQEREKIELKYRERMNRWSREITEYAKKWNFIRKMYRENPQKNTIPKPEEFPLPEVIESLRPKSEEELTEQKHNAISTQKRIESIQAFSQFVRSESHGLIKFGSYKHFTVQQAFNYAKEGPVTDDAVGIIKEIENSTLILLEPLWRPEYISLPALLQNLEGHTSYVTSVYINREGGIVVSGSNDGTIRIWEQKTGRCLKILIGHSDEVECLHMTPDDNIVVSGSNDQSIRLWDTGSGECIKVLKGHKSAIYAIYITPDGGTVVSGSADRTIRVWNIEDEECISVLKGHEGEIYGIGVTPDAKIAVSAGNRDQTIRVWDLINEECIQVFAVKEARVTCIDISPDGKIAISGGAGGILRVWNLETGKCIHVLEGNEGMGSLAGIMITPYGIKTFSENEVAILGVSITSDAQYAVSAGGLGKTLQLWDIKNGIRLKKLKGQLDCLRSVCIALDGRFAISGGGLSANERAITHHEEENRIGFEDNIIRIWNIQDGIGGLQIDNEHNGIVYVHLSNDGKRAASCGKDGTIKIWNLEKSISLYTEKNETEYPIECVCLSPDGQKLVFGRSIDHNVIGKRYILLMVLDIEQKSLKNLTGPSRRVLSVCVTADGRVISGDMRNEIWVSNTAGSDSFNLGNHKGGVKSIHTSPDGVIVVSGSEDQTIGVWSLATKKSIHLLRGHEGSVNSVYIAPDGKQIASGSSDKTIRLWDIETGECLNVFEGHTDWISSLFITPDGKSIFSGSWDKTIREWDINTGECVSVFQTNNLINSISGINSSGNIIVGTLEGKVIFLKLHNLSITLPILTPICSTLNNQKNSFWNYLKKTKHWTSENLISCLCWHCGEWFIPDVNVINTINSIYKSSGLLPDQSPCLELSREIQDEPKLVSTCSKCGKPVKFNPFFSVVKRVS